ncbi:aldolase/citrate lyase family protein [Gaopeijia maritima]|uniref:Aldolase/citrate lyase family protein n=1 Tax=Gaopeijia maritima TaxID=3119007 RepID=A0ABU9E9G2_9BACT
MTALGHRLPGAAFRLPFLPLAAALTLSGCGSEPEAADDLEAGTPAAVATSEQSLAIRLWADGEPAFGIYVPSERERGATGPDGERLPPLYTEAGGADLAGNELYDYLFLNLEGSYDPAAVTAIARGLEQGGGADKTLLVRIPPISDAGEEVTRQRIAEILEAGADGITLPHVRSTEEARTAVSMFEELGADVWSPSNPEGTVIAMLMIEDPGALAETEQIADVGGYSILACGIGSLSAALGDREAGEAGNQVVLQHAQRVGLPDMITANADDVARRIEEGFLGLLMNGPEADEHIRVGRTAAGR